MGLHSNNVTAALKTKTIWRSLLKNLILQNCLHRLNIRECGYYTKTDQIVVHDIIASCCTFSLPKYNRIFGKNLEHDTYEVKQSP